MIRGTSCKPTCAPSVKVSLISNPNTWLSSDGTTPVNTASIDSYKCDNSEDYYDGADYGTAEYSRLGTPTAEGAGPGGVTAGDASTLPASFSCSVPNGTTSEYTIVQECKLEQLTPGSYPVGDVKLTFPITSYDGHENKLANLDTAPELIIFVSLAATETTNNGCA